jgi:hypothetical protein
MPKIVIPVATEDDVPAASDQLSRQIERLELGKKKKIVVYYPKRFANDLGIGERQNRAIYRGHDAFGRIEVPWEVVIEYED